MIKNTFHFGLKLPKILIIAKKPSNKSCSTLNFVQKSPQGHMSISPQSGARGLKRFIKKSTEKVLGYITLSYDATHIWTVFSK